MYSPRTFAWLLALPLCTLPVLAAPASDGHSGILVDNLRVRSTPSAEGKVLGRLPKGTPVKGETEGEWLRLTEGRFAGRYISLAFVAAKAEEPGSAPGASLNLQGKLAANRELTRALAADLLNRRDYAGAEELLTRHLAGDAEDAAAWNSLGLVRLELKKNSEAEDAFRRAGDLAEGEDKAIYLYNAADAANRGGAIDLTRSRLESAQQAAIGVAGVVGEQIARIRNVIRAGEPLPPLRLGAASDKSSGFSGSLALRAGFDSNVMLLPNDPNAGAAPRSALLGVNGLLGYQRALGSGLLTAQSTTAFTFYTSGAVRSFNNLGESLNVSWSPQAGEGRAFTANYGNRADFTFLNTDGLKFFSWTDSLYATFSYRFAENKALVLDLPVGYQKFPGVAAGADDERDGLLLTPSALYRWQTGVYSFSSGLTYQQVWAEGRNYRSRSGGVLGGISRPLPAEIRARLGVGFTRTSYHDSVGGRADSKFDASLSLGRAMPFDRRMNVSLDYIFGRNLSNLSSATYSQHTAFVQVNYALP